VPARPRAPRVAEIQRTTTIPVIMVWMGANGSIMAMTTWSAHGLFMIWSVT
jgi:hypothetical protein